MTRYEAVTCVHHIMNHRYGPAILNYHGSFCNLRALPELLQQENQGSKYPSRVYLPKTCITDPNMGSYQIPGPLLGLPNTGCRIMLRTQKRTISLTTTHIGTLDTLRESLGPVTSRCSVAISNSTNRAGCPRHRSALACGRIRPSQTLGIQHIYVRIYIHINI